MKTRPLYIFDIDGTLANCSHRQHLLQDHGDRDRWHRFYAACAEDESITPIMLILNALLMAGSEVWYFTGRSEEVRHKTEAWFDFHMRLDVSHFGPKLMMRPIGDHRTDDVLKAEWLDRMLPEDRARLVAVFEDRTRVVEMWRSRGIQCLQVAAGDF